jgi:transposase
MARPRRIDKRLVVRAKKVVATSKNIHELRAAQAVLFPALAQMTLEKTASFLGVGRSTVPWLQKRFRERAKGTPQKKWGGRRKSLMSWEEEKKFLAPWEKLSQGGGMIVVSPMRAALAQKLGRPIAATVVYRMLARHDWRKVAPDTRHPKSDPAVQEDWKKNFRKSWRVCVRAKRFENAKFV